jgi:hypothetical protein
VTSATPASRRRNVSHGLQELSRGGLFQNDPADAKPYRLEDLFVGDLGGEQNHPRRDALAMDLAQHLDSIAPGHADVEHQDRGPRPAYRGERFLAVATACHHLDVVRRGEEMYEPVEDDRVIVGDDDARRHGREVTSDRNPHLNSRAF